jgi:hypothetical protein
LCVATKRHPTTPWQVSPLSFAGVINATLMAPKRHDREQHRFDKWNSHTLKQCRHTRALPINVRLAFPLLDDC